MIFLSIEDQQVQARSVYLKEPSCGNNRGYFFCNFTKIHDFTIAKSLLIGDLFYSAYAWQGLQDDYRTYCGLVSISKEEGHDNA